MNSFKKIHFSLSLFLSHILRSATNSWNSWKIVNICIHIFAQNKKKYTNGWRRKRNDAQPFITFFIQTQCGFYTSNAWRKENTASQQNVMFFKWKMMKKVFSRRHFFSLLLLVLLLYAHVAYLSSNLHEYCIGPFHSLGLNHWIIRIRNDTVSRFFPSSFTCTCF